MAGIICDHNAKKPQNANLNAVIIAAQNVPFWKRQVKRFRKLPHKKHKINIDFQMKYPSFFLKQGNIFLFWMILRSLIDRK